jgi:hypothetical protein
MGKVVQPAHWTITCFLDGIWLSLAERSGFRPEVLQFASRCRNVVDRIEALVSATPTSMNIMVHHLRRSGDADKIRSTARANALADLVGRQLARASRITHCPNEQHQLKDGARLDIHATPEWGYSVEPTALCCSALFEALIAQVSVPPSLLPSFRSLQSAIPEPIHR